MYMYYICDNLSTNYMTINTEYSCIDNLSQFRLGLIREFLTKNYRAKVPLDGKEAKLVRFFFSLTYDGDVNL